MIQTLSSLLLSALFAAAAPTNGAIEARQSSCAPVYVIFCRGTLETAPLGTIVGPIFASTLENLIPDVSVVGVTYPADIEGYLEGGDPIGISDMETLAESYASSCPDGTIVLSGYRYVCRVTSRVGTAILTTHSSQGAQITHDALNDLESSNTAVFDLIKAVVWLQFVLILYVSKPNCANAGNLGRPIPQ